MPLRAEDAGAALARLRELAREAAFKAHIRHRDDGHGFEGCPHPDCMLVWAEPPADGWWNSPVLQAVLDAIKGTLDPSTQIADHPNVKFAQMQRLDLVARAEHAEQQCAALRGALEHVSRFAHVGMRRGPAIDGWSEAMMTACALLTVPTAGAAMSAPSGSPPRRRRPDVTSTDLADVGKLRWTIDNIYTVARRESRHAEVSAHRLRPEMWAHVMRLCEAVGAKARTVGVLRAEAADGEPGEDDQ